MADKEVNSSLTCVNLYTRAPHSQLRVAQAEKEKKKKRGLYVLLGTEKKKIVQKTNGGCALMGGS